MTLEKYFEEAVTKEERNSAIIMNVFVDGPTQSSMAEYLDVPPG